MQRFADDPLTECPECGSRIRRVIQPVGVVFKGSGWYITDSRPSGSSDGAERTAKSTSTDKTTKSDNGGKSDATTKTEKSPAKIAD
ncbi:MAG: FmdB family zinc ribbon protein [Thermomicrobiales bacterium]